MALVGGGRGRTVRHGGEKLKADDKAGAEKIVTKLSQNANKANNEVLPFGFRYCRLEPSRFT